MVVISVYADVIRICQFPDSSSFDVIWAKTRLSPSLWYIKVVIATKVTLCLLGFVISTESLWASGNSTVVYKTQHIDIMDIRYFKQ